MQVCQTFCNRPVGALQNRGPVRVNRFTSTRRGRPPNVRYASKSDRTAASQRSAALCQPTYAAPLSPIKQSGQLQRAQAHRYLPTNSLTIFAMVGSRSVEAVIPLGARVAHPRLCWHDKN